jgi:NTE family protein
MRTYFCLLVLVLLCDPAFAAAADPDPPQRPRIALVLSGGGARGLAHVGVLQVLEQMRIPVDCVVGTSMGALVGGTYAAGVRPGKMREVLDKNDIGLLFDDLPPRADIPQTVRRDDYRPLFDFTLGYNDGQVRLPVGASAGYKFELFLKNLIGRGAAIGGLDFDTLPTPYRAIATDLETGEMKVFADGDLAKVMRASMSLPAIVAPTQIGEHLYVDGGLLRNLPVDIGRELCGDIIIAVNLGTPLLKRDKLRSVFDVAGQSVHLMMEQNVRRSLGELTGNDVLIEPELDEFSASAFGDKDEIIERGVRAAQASSQTLQPLAIGQAAYDTWLAERVSRTPPAVDVARIRVKASQGFNAKAVEKDLRVKAGKDFNYEDLDREIAMMYGRADFAYLGYSVVPEEGGATLVIDAEAKPWGPGYLKFGLGAASDFTSPTQLNVAASYRRSWANSLGGEWRVDAQAGFDSFLGVEFMQPLQVRDGAFIAPHIEARRTAVPYYIEDTRFGQFFVDSAGGGLDAGVTGTVGDVRLGPYIAAVHTRPDFGAISFFIPEQDLVVSGLRLSAIADQLDSPILPHSGWYASLNGRTTHVTGDAEDDYTRVFGVLRGVKSFGANTFSLKLETGHTLDGEISVYDTFQLGGPQRLSGLYLDQLSGSRYNLGVLSYYRQYSRLPSQIGRGLYVGMSAEAGRTDDPLMKTPWDWVYGGSVYWVADTVLGAVYLGYGISSLNQRSAYLMIGPRF